MTENSRQKQNCPKSENIPTDVLVELLQACTEYLDNLEDEKIAGNNLARLDSLITQAKILEQNYSPVTPVRREIA